MKTGLVMQLCQQHAHILEPLGYSLPVDIARENFTTFRQACSRHLSWRETRELYRQSQQYVASLKAYHRKIFTHANPQLTQAVHLAISPVAYDSRDYEQLFGQRADAYVKTNSVASMFSPAGYLTELYREGKALHAEGHQLYLDTRRPDLLSLSLSQSNLDTEISTLALSNEILTSAIDADDIDTTFTQTFYPFDLPYHAPYSTLEFVFNLQDSSFETIAEPLASSMANLTPAVTRAAFANHLSPTLAQELITPIPSSTDELETMLLKHFGTADAVWLADVEHFCEQVGIVQDELSTYTDLSTFSDNDSAALIDLSKRIRYSQLCGLSPSILDRLIALSGDGSTLPSPISETTLSFTARALLYRERFGLNEADAVVLVGGDIDNTPVPEGQLNQFDSLFNTPPLNDIVFTTDDTEDSINFDPSDTTYVQERAVLKRTLGVDDAGLLVLAQIADHDDLAWPRSLSNISMLYRIGLLARVHDLTPQALQVLLQLNGKTENLLEQNGIQAGDFTDYLDAVYTSHQNLLAQQLTVTAVDVMTTCHYPTAMTPEIDNFLQMLYHAGQSATPDNRKEILAPSIAAGLGLADREIALLLEDWIEQIATEQSLVLTDIEAYWAEIVVYFDQLPLTSADTESLAAFSHAMAQLAQIIKTWKLSTAELSLLVDHPDTLPSETAGKLSLTLYNLQHIHQFKTLQQAVNEGVSELLSALADDQLEVSTLARLLDQPQEEIQHAADAIGAKNQPLTAVQGAQIVDWLNIASSLGVSVASVNSLLTTQSTQSFAHWLTLAGDFQAGLQDKQTVELSQQQDEARSTALCAIYLVDKAPTLTNVTLKDRDDVFQYLLIDNQVSGQIQTTRIAEAIASVQLYINRCLQGMDPDINRSLLQNVFFVEWDQYNKRYSTWSGVSQLAYYPENYIDPSLRYNQTSLQQQLVTEISQSQLSKASVETAYMNYLDNFEDIANLKVISGYHHGAAFMDGMTYFIGRSHTLPYRYFWRSLNQSGGTAGQFSASAWSEWEAINVPINAVDEEIRPVILNNRLHIGWVEAQTVESDSSEAGSPETKLQYTYNLSYRKINNSWSQPRSFNWSADIAPTDGKPPISNYLTYNSEWDAMLVVFYVPEEVVTSESLSYKKLDSALNEMDSDSEDIETILTLIQHNLNNSPDQNKLANLIGSLSYQASSSQIGQPSGSLDDSVTFINKQISAEIDNSTTPPRLLARGDVEINYADDSASVKSVGDATFYNLLGAPALIISTSTDYTPLIDVTVGEPDLGIRIEGIGDFAYYRAHVSMDLTAIELNEYVDAGSLDAAFSTYASDTIGSGKWVVDRNETFELDEQGSDDDSTHHAIMDAYTDYRNCLAVENIQSTEDTVTFDCIVPVQLLTGAKANAFFYTTKNTGNDGDFYTEDWEITDNFTLDEYPLDNSTITTPYFEFGQLRKELEFGRNVISGVAAEWDIRGGTLVKELSLYVLSPGKKYSETYQFTASLESNGNTDYGEIISDSERKSIYMALSNYPLRTRLNTLFAQDLIAKANIGLDMVLSWDTQNIQEPQLGAGGYVNLTFSPYDSDTHGEGSDVTVYFINQSNASAGVELITGSLSDQSTSMRVFLPCEQSEAVQDVALGFEYSNGKLSFEDETQQFTFAGDTLTASSGNLNRTPGLADSNVLYNNTEPMDFNGANGLYFWELFYYTPMLVVEKLLQAKNFEETTQWLAYVFSPQGYNIPAEGEGLRLWNVRPLEEDTAWDVTQIDSSDPDIVAQGDPMHYKVATYMKMLDLLIARGDMAYRQLERDTLAEAKMWYVTALNLLGKEPDIPLSGNWSDPTLSAAASDTAHSLATIEQLIAGQSATPGAETRNANSLTALFLPTENTKLKGYWQTLDQRLYNLRNNLSIDGQLLTLPIYATPADPKTLQHAAAAASSGAGSLPGTSIAIQRFPLMLNDARNLVAQLIQYGSSLTTALERKDSEALNTLLDTQAQDLLRQSLQLQNKTCAQLEAEQNTLSASLAGALARREHYQQLLDEGISRAEQQCIDERITSGALTTSANAMRTAGAAMDLAPNIFGMAVGGSRWGAVTTAMAFGMDASAAGLVTSAEARSTSEQYRRRAQEWTIQRDTAEHDIQQIEAQQASLAIQSEAALLQKGYVETQQAQIQVQLDFLKTKFSNEALYSWMQGRLSAVFYPFYDLAIACCLKAQLGYQWETSSATTFIQPGAWDSNHAGLQCGEALALNLAQMESAYVDWDARALEVKRTVSMAQAMGLDSAAFNAEVNKVLDETVSTLTPHTLALNTDKTVFIASIDLEALDILSDYPDSVVGTDKVRRIKQVSVSLPALLGPYQDIQAVLGYSASGGGIHQSCIQTAISHGMNDSGQFQLDFNEGKYLPFEGLPIDGGNSASLTLTFPNVAADKKQHDLVQTLSDIILHISYTIRK
ncbi:neuraminidase-like domain-containing protein [Shewanella sp. YLB-07]|uniref:Tc toxin subunit A-related protein n=1 Tax=Shewanella sp. YLB-07 TaxID=2601268 RepID=UPI00128AEFDE|nr:neuraminidase-like domain-containing protein [Shewanella sp. YLB-07]MPY24335.1 hypothetical protein [Shewanella sp. YLB-07]